MTASTASTASTATTATTAAAATSSAASASSAPSASPTVASAGAHDSLGAPPAVYQGWKTFHVYCYRCHGTDAMGSTLAPNLRHSVSSEGSVTHAVFVTTVKEGRPEKGMPTWKALLDDEQIENLYAYVRARSAGTLAAGRPHPAKP
jgi:mono/diheme cytochrome c family protein